MIHRERRDLHAGDLDDRLWWDVLRVDRDSRPGQALAEIPPRPHVELEGLLEMRCQISIGEKIAIERRVAFVE